MRSSRSPLGSARWPIVAGWSLPDMQLVRECLDAVVVLLRFLPIAVGAHGKAAAVFRFPSASTR